MRVPVSLDAAGGGDRADAAVCAGEEEVVDRVALREALAYLPDRERQIIVSRFFEHRSQQDTAALLGISQMQVSRLERKILDELKKKLLE